MRGLPFAPIHQTSQLAFKLCARDQRVCDRIWVLQTRPSRPHQSIESEIHAGKIKVSGFGEMSIKIPPLKHLSASITTIRSNAILHSSIRTIPDPRAIASASTIERLARESVSAADLEKKKKMPRANERDGLSVRPSLRPGWGDQRICGIG